MENSFNQRQLVQHKKIAIPTNIKLGEMINELLNGVNPKLLQNVIPQLKKEFSTEHSENLNTKEKIEHVQMVLDKILLGKYNFAKQNIEEGEKFNDFYPDDPIDLPTQERNFQCLFCKERFFKTNASLHSHYRSCTEKLKDEKSEEKKVQSEKKESFRPLRSKDQTINEFKPKKVLTVEIIKKEDVKKEKDQNQHEGKGKRSRPSSSYSLGSDIFYEE